MHRSIYRVQNIPEAYNCEQFEESLLKAVGLEKKALLRCRSFANDASRPRHILTKTAIVSFETSLSILDKERCKLSDGQSTFYCDNVFDGFTPVSPLETASQQIIELVLHLYVGVFFPRMLVFDLAVSSFLVGEDIQLDHLWLKALLTSGYWMAWHETFHSFVFGRMATVHCYMIRLVAKTSWSSQIPLCASCDAYDEALQYVPRLICHQLMLDVES
jgi:hypothetical protein